MLTSQQMTALGVGTKPGQQLIQLASGGQNLSQGQPQLATHVAIQKGQALGQGPSQMATHVAIQKGQALTQGGSQMATHVAIQKGQSGGLQFHSLHLKPSGTAMSQAAKVKTKKKTTPTAPK